MHVEHNIEMVGNTSQKKRKYEKNQIVGCRSPCALFRWEEKIREKKIRENYFLLLMFRWIEKERKENNKKIIFYYLIKY